MGLSTGPHVFRFALMAVAALLIVGRGVHFGFFNSTHQRSSSRDGSAPDPFSPSDRPDVDGSQE
jgi:hypothetical protein